MTRYYCFYCSEELSGDEADWICDNCGAQFWGLSYDDETDEETMDEMRGFRGAHYWATKLNTPDDQEG